MNENNFRNSEFENMLKDKIDELASSVDCFDKISNKAFPEERKEYSDSEYTICDLENITGKKRGFRFLPAAVMAVAAVVCIAVIPKNGFVNSFFNMFTGSDKKIYRELINEINEETSDGDYVWFDCTLDEYIANDINITPLYSCPFEAGEKDDINVRIFVKMYGSLPTNQIYAVQYEGEYSEANYIAAADSKAKFTDEELAQNYSIVNFPNVRGEALELVEKAFGGRDKHYLMNGSNLTHVSSISYDCLYKYRDKAYPISSEVVVFTQENSLDSYYYDYLTMYYNEQNEKVMFDTSAFAGSWNNVVYFNGSSAESKGSLSAFTKTDIVSETELTGELETTVSYIDPFENYSLTSGVAHTVSGVSDTDISRLYIYSEDMKCGYAPIPLNQQLHADFRMYTCYTDENFAVSFTELTDNLNEAVYSESHGNIDSVINSTDNIMTYQNGFLANTIYESDLSDELLDEMKQYQQELITEQVNLEALYAKKAELDAQDAEYEAVQSEIEEVLKNIEEAELEIERIRSENELKQETDN